MMSIRPKLSTAVWTSLSGASPLVRSPEKTAVSPWISDAACSATSPSRSLMTTLAPCELSSSAVARPMPRADPVTIATLSSSTPIRDSLCSAPGKARRLVAHLLGQRDGGRGEDRLGEDLEDDVEMARRVGLDGR